MKNPDCIFCKIARAEIPTQKVGESNNFLAFLDTHPKANGHTLIISKKHFVTLLDIPNALGEEFLKFAKEIASKLLEEKKGNGFNLVMNNLEPAGQVIKHAHIHIIPRNDGDGLRMIA